MKKVGLIMGSASDLPVVEKAVAVLDELGIGYEVHVYSAHRCPDKAADFARNAEKNGFAVLVGFAGMAAHLAGALAANTVLPVIGVPCKSNVMDGVDALLSTVMMPSGVPGCVRRGKRRCQRRFACRSDTRDERRNGSGKTSRPPQKRQRKGSRVRRGSSGKVQ